MEGGLAAANELCYIEHPENRLAIDQRLLDLLVCPACKTPVKLTTDGEGLRCPSCRLVYPIRDGFPVMIKEEARTET